MSVTQMTAEEYSELQADLVELDAEFAELGFDMASADDHAEDAIAELDAELAGTELAPMAASSMSFQEMGLGEDGEVDEFFFNWIKNKVKKLLRKLVKMAKKYKGCAKCIGKVTKAVALFKAKKYPAALKAAYDAYRCFRSCAS